MASAANAGAGFALDGKCCVVTGGGSGIGAAICRHFAAQGANVVVVDLNLAEAEQVAAAVDGLAIRSGTKVTSDVLAAAKNLRIVGRAGIGVDNVDINAATEHGVVVVNTPEGNNITTAEHAIALIVSLARHIPQATASMKAGKWEKKKFQGMELYNRTLGVLGAGNIGRALLSYRRFDQQNFHITHVFDNNPATIGTTISDRIIHDVAVIEEELARSDIQLGIIAVPAPHAQAVADTLVASGVSGILNFAPRRVEVPPTTTVSSVDFTLSLEQLAFQVNLASDNQTEESLL